MAKKTTRKKLTTALDTVFSLYIRHRDSVNGMVACATCGIVQPINKMHAGHFMSRGKRITRWDEENVHGQCPSCNLWKNGRQYEMSIHIDQKYGAGKADELLLKSNQKSGFTDDDMRAMAAHFKNKLDKLKNDY